MTRAWPPLLLLACAGDPAANWVQDGAGSAPNAFVSKSAAEGFAPECKAIAPGDTVQWENADPELPANITSTTEPPELYSPNLQGAFVTWSHTFEAAGIWDYYDTNSGDPGRAVVDAYYGTVTFAGTSPTTQRGTVCVSDDAAPCCCTDLDCAPGESCTEARACVPTP